MFDLRYKDIFRVLAIFKRIIKYRVMLLMKTATTEDLCRIHFSMWSDANHINREGLALALSLTSKVNPVVFETGTSAYGTDSTRLLDRFTEKYSGEFHSVDLNPRASRALLLQHGSRTNLHTSDSIEFIKRDLIAITAKVDLCYLDSWDVNWLDPLPSAEHGLNEFLAVKTFLFKDSILIIDDTPASIDYVPVAYRDEALKFLKTYGVLPGKGSLALKAIKETNFGEVLLHQYNVVIRIL
jgi:hypothetical protein